MPLDAEEAALLVRVTARISAGLLAANLLASTRRINGSGARYRTADVRLFVAFITFGVMHLSPRHSLCSAVIGAMRRARRAGR